MESDVPLVEAALTLAYRAHSGQTSFSGRPYILHPIRVMEAMHSDYGRCTALLHDVLEDTATTEQDLREWFPDVVVDAVVSMTHLEDESYEDYVERVAQNSLATAVKLADLRDNTRIERIPRMTDGAFRRLKKYHRAIRRLEQE